MATREPAAGADLSRYAWLSVAAAVITIALKAAAYLVTGSVGLLSDALESVVNLVAALVAVWSLRAAAAPPDAEHEYGRSKAEYFSSGVEGALIFVAALAIIATAIPRLIAPRPLEAVGIGLTVSAVASVVNLAVARVLIRVGVRRRSIALEADGRHLMTDVWTSAGVIVGVALVVITGVPILDPIVAMLVAANILWMGTALVRRSMRGLLDAAIAPEQRAQIVEVLDHLAEDGASWHALRTRQAGARTFVTVHVLVPGSWSVQRGHDLLEKVEEAIRACAPGTVVMTHLEPLEDERSWSDLGLTPGEPP